MVECGSGGHGREARKLLAEGVGNGDEVRQFVELCSGFGDVQDISVACGDLCQFLEEHGEAVSDVASDVVKALKIVERITASCMERDIESDFREELRLVNALLSLCSDLVDDSVGQFLVQLAVKRKSCPDETSNEVLLGLVPFTGMAGLFDQGFFASMSSYDVDRESLEPFLALFVAFTRNAKLYLHMHEFISFVHRVFNSFSTIGTASQLSIALRNLFFTDTRILDDQGMKRNWISWFRFAKKDVHKHLLEMCVHMTSGQISILSSFDVVETVKSVVDSDGSDSRLDAALMALRRYIQVKPLECYGQYFEDSDLDGMAMAIVRHVLNGSFSLRVTAGHLMASLCIEFSGTYGKIFRCADRQDLMMALVEAIQWTLDCDDTELHRDMLKGVSMLVFYASGLGCLPRMRECLSQDNIENIISRLRESNEDYNLTIEQLAG